MTKYALAILTGGVLFVASANAATLYSTIPDPTIVAPVYSLPYEAFGVSEFGGLITPVAGNLNSATVLLSNWAYKTAYGGSGDGYDATLTLKLYNPDLTPYAGQSSSSTSIHVLWRPEPTIGPGQGQCPSGGAAVDDPFSAGQPYYQNGSCYSGATVLAQFAFNNLALSGNLIYGVSFNTQNAGYNPTGVSGPTNSLNFGWSLAAAPVVGTNPVPDSGYYAATGDPAMALDPNPNYAELAACLVEGVDSACPTGRYFTGAIALSTDVVPEPGTISMFLIGLGGIAFGSFRKAQALGRSAKGE